MGAGDGLLGVRKVGRVPPPLFMGGTLTAVQGTVQGSDRDALVKPAKLLLGAGSDSATGACLPNYKAGDFGR